MGAERSRIPSRLRDRPDPGRPAALFERCGYEDVRVEDVAKAACVSMSTLHARYPHKRTLLAGIVKAFVDNFAVHLDALTERRHDADVKMVCAKVGGGGGKWAIDPGGRR
ncbi:MAG: TetR/AcrR family transcriptional regulator [Deltaproteobacteria bacterium]|nr:TetR/AcrR family transcriptional regulator [Deltaproteobacteria bacterium]